MKYETISVSCAEETKLGLVVHFSMSVISVTTSVVDGCERTFNVALQCIHNKRTRWFER